MDSNAFPTELLGIGPRHSKILSARFGKPFERTVGSGARFSQVKGMTEASKQTLLGDISVPDGFHWVLECKSGYEDKIDLGSSSSLCATPACRS